MKKAICTLAILSALSAQAAGNHDHHHDEKVAHIGAHVHGVAQLNVVLEDDELEVTLETPAMNVMGFEHEPRSEADLETSHKALHTLEDAEWLVINGGKCRLHEADVDWQYADAVHAHFHGDKADDDHHDHDAHDHDEHHHGHDHDSHKHDDDHDEHQHDAHDHEAHSDVDAEFEFDCQQPKTLQSIKVELFEHFSGFEKIDVQWIVGDKQGAQTLTPNAHELHLH